MNTSVVFEVSKQIFAQVDPLDKQNHKKTQKDASNDRILVVKNFECFRDWLSVFRSGIWFTLNF